MPTTELIDSFVEFAHEQVRQHGDAISMDELYDEWRSRNPPSDDWLAIRASLEDMAAGEVGEDFAVFATSIRQCHEL